MGGNFTVIRGCRKNRFRLAARQSVLFVCKANICRSPLAEVVLRRYLREAGVAADVDSAGTHDYLEGMPAHPSAVAAAKRRGYDVTRVVARRIRPADFHRFDLVLGMDRANLAELRRMAPPHRHKLGLLLGYGTLFGPREVPDPYGGGVAGFERSLDLIEKGCRALVQRIVAQAEVVRQTPRV
jgi:protein-tyrosine phosphatase